jgi:threonine/homoserine/homoserine lactone efflux protein
MSYLDDTESIPPTRGRRRFADSRAVFSTSEFAGDVYLTCLREQAIRHGDDNREAAEVAGPRPPSMRLLREGVSIEVSNPKGTDLFVAVHPQFVS